jgi:hypothetical protein
MILKVHLLTEYYLERLIHLCLKRGDRVIDNGRLSYQQKLVLVDSMDILDDMAIQCLKNLNKLRNGFVHKINKKITMEDVEILAKPLGHESAKLRNKAKNNLLIFFHTVLSFICGLVGALVAYHEKQIISKSGKMRFVKKDLSPR